MSHKQTDHNNETMLDYFLESIASHSPECECSKCLQVFKDRHSQQEVDCGGDDYGYDQIAQEKANE